MVADVETFRKFGLNLKYALFLFRNAASVSKVESFEIVIAFRLNCCSFAFESLIEVELEFIENFKTFDLQFADCTHFTEPEI